MAQEFFTIEKSGQGVNVVLLTLPVELDAAEFDELNRAIFEQIDAQPGGKWILDLTQAIYMGSAMLGLMVNIRQHVLQGQGKLALCCLSRRLTEIFRTCSLERLFLIAPTRAEALRGI